MAIIRGGTAEDTGGDVRLPLARPWRIFHKVKLARLPSMADFATWVVAAEPALPWEPGTFLAAYTRNRAAVVEYSLEGDPVAVAVRCSWSAGRNGKELRPIFLMNLLMPPGNR